MLLHRMIEYAKGKNLTALILLFLSGLLIWNTPFAAKAAPMASDDVPTALLKACDARAATFDDYPEPIADAAAALIALGVFDVSEFHDIRIGFCGLRDANGPVATTSCADNIILMDNKYAETGQSLPLAATLAHEMLHTLQHKEKKAEVGDRYCTSGAYVADRGPMEIDADRFGEGVSALLVLGRPVEIHNKCPFPVAAYVEPAASAAVDPFPASFFRVTPKSAITVPARSRSKHFLGYAEEAQLSGDRPLIVGKHRKNERIIDGKRIDLAAITLASNARAHGSFLLNILCAE